MAAQSTGDTLPTQTATPPPSTTPVLSPAAATPTVETVWIGRLVSNNFGATKGEGSIFRVSVEGILDTPIELRIDDKLIVANSGAKPEYGKYAAEFAPVTAGTWQVSVPALGASLEVVADNYNLAVIEFVQIPAAEATQMVLPTATATPIGAMGWEGEVMSESSGAAGPFARLLVRVMGLDNHPVRLSTISQVINTANTGQKPDELGPNMVEFAGLTPGHYIVEPAGLNVSVEVELKPYVETLVEFRPRAATTAPPPTATFSPTPVPLLPVATFTAAAPPTSPPPAGRPSATETATPTPTIAPPASPTSVAYWLGVVESRRDVGTEAGSITVSVEGIEGLSVRLHSLHEPAAAERRCITGRDGLGQDACAFNNLAAGHYLIEPEGLRVSLPVSLFEHEALKTHFSLELLPAGMGGWQAQIHKNTNGFQPMARSESIITVRVAGWAGQVIALRSAQGASKFCEVIYNPVLGGLICEFGNLGPGVYQLEAATTGATTMIFVDGAGEAVIEFSPTATGEMLALLQSPPLAGHGARPQRSVALPATIPPAPLVLAQPAATETPLPLPTLAPTAATTWQGYIVETARPGIGAIGIRAAGLKDHPVILQSGNWQSPPQLTGTKVELGDYSAEFGGLGPGEYLVELVDLAELRVTLEPGQFILVEFRPDPLRSP